MYRGSLGRELTTAEQSAPFVLIDRKAKRRKPDELPIDGLVVLDGTWSQAKSMWWRNAWLLKLNRVILHPREPSAYGRLRKQPSHLPVATLEATSLDPEASDSIALIAVSSGQGRSRGRSRGRKRTGSSPTRSVISSILFPIGK